MKTVKDAAVEFVLIFDRLNIPYVLMGGIAVRLHGIPRATYDVDFVILLDRDRLLEIYDAAMTISGIGRPGILGRVIAARNW